MKKLFLASILGLSLILGFNSCSKKNDERPISCNVCGSWQLDSSSFNGLVEYSSYAYTEKWQINSIAQDSVSIIQHFFYSDIDDNNPHIFTTYKTDTTISISNTMYKYINTSNILMFSDSSKKYWFSKIVSI